MSFKKKFNPESDRCDFFESIVDSTVSRNMPYSELSSHFDQHVVKTGLCTIDSDETLFKMILVEIKEKKEYALIVSIGHTIADGYTFYTLYGMLDGSTPVQSLTVERQQSFATTLEEVRGPVFIKWVKSLPVLIGILFNKFIRRRPPGVIYKVNMKYIEEVKKNFQAQLQLQLGADTSVFISTNDIITSWFFHLCQCNLGMMAINLRNRFISYTDTHAGNYETVLWYNRSDYSQPVFIRDSLKVCRSKSSRVPSVIDSLWLQFGMISNWSGFYSEVSLGGSSRPVCHMPLTSLHDRVFRDHCNIFHLDKDTLAVFLTCRSVDIEQLVMSGDTRVNLLGERVL